jgi:hypothetical protein
MPTSHLMEGIRSDAAHVQTSGLAAGIRAIAGAAYRWLIAVFVLTVVVEFFLAGAGAFGQKSDVALGDQKSWDPHRALGYILIGGALLLLVVCLLWWSERIWLMATFLLAVLAFLQSVLAHVGLHHRWVGALHPLNAIAILGLSGYLAHRAWRRDLVGR